MQRIVEETVESAIKINIFILKQHNIFPKTYQDSFLELKILNIFTTKELKELAKTAKFRNILAYEYDDLTDDIFLNRTKLIIDLFPDYLKKIYKHLDN